ncbi:MAG: hypothetical protein WC376_03180, partial [Candidatus Nanoarchaeia archaeon]
MKKLILAVLLLFVLSIGFSDAISDFVKNNLNFVIAAFVFILIFGISMGTAGIWVEKPGEIVGIALGISALISVLVLLNPNLSAIVTSIIQYSPIFLIIFVVIFLLIIVLFTNKRSHPWIKGIAAAILIAVIIGIIYLNASGGVSGESGSSASAMDAGTIIITILAVLGVGVTAFVMFKSKSQGSQSSQQSGGGGGNAAMSISANRNPKKTTIKGKVLDYRVKSKGTPLKGLKVTAETDPIISNLEATTNNNGEFEISFPESIPAVIKIKKIETEYSGIKYNHLMYNGRPNINTGNRGSEFNLTKGKTIHNIVVPINKPSVPLAAGEARIKGKVMHYAADGKSGASITGAAIKLTKGADVKNTVTDSLGNFQITLLAAELPKYDGSELTAEVSGETYSHRFIFGCFDKKRALAKPQTGKELEAVIPVIVPEFLTQFKN